MDLEANVKNIWHGGGHHSNFLWQPELYKDDINFGVPWQIEAYRNPIFLYKGYGT